MSPLLGQLCLKQIYVRVFFQQLCVFFNLPLCYFYTPDKLTLSFATILRGDSTLKKSFLYLWYSGICIPMMYLSHSWSPVYRHNSCKNSCSTGQYTSRHADREHSRIRPHLERHDIIFECNFFLLKIHK